MMISKLTVALLGFGIVCAPVFGADQAPANSSAQVQPGTVNYVEGAVSLEGKPLQARDPGHSVLEPGQVLTTGAGRVELLLTPGVFLRLDDQSAVRMVSPDLVHTQVELVQGRAGVEVDEIHPQNDLEIINDGVVTQLVKEGYYEFDVRKATAMVFEGKAAVEVSDGKYKVVKDHHEFTLTGAPGKPINLEKPANFNAHNPEDDLYKWSSLRSQYLAEANNQIAGNYAGMANFNAGWYWDPYLWGYTYIGMGPYWSPFGWGFYSPWYFGGGFYGRGFYGRGGYGGGFHGGGYGGGFHGGGGMAGGGGGHR